jgi:hypothetical protein
VKDYYDILDVPLTATFDEVKAQYKRLVRIYHPDRFTNSLDKVYAERKLQELNQAFSALSARAKTAHAYEASHAMPIPIVEPASLDLGVVKAGQQQRVKFQVGNAGATAKGISFAYTDDHSWYTINKGRQLFPDKALPIELEVLVNTNTLKPGHSYQSWFDVNMDGVTARVGLRLQVGALFTPLFAFSQRLTLVVATCFLIIATTLAIPLVNSFSISWSLPSLTPQTISLIDAQAASGESPKKAPIENQAAEWLPLFSPDHHQVAFISSQLGASQIFIRDPSSGRLRQVTHGTEQKSTLTWSPDSRRLAFVVTVDDRTTVHVFTLADSTTIIFAPTPSMGVTKRLGWTDDSNGILFDFYRQDERQFYRATLLSRQVERIAAPADW